MQLAASGASNREIAAVRGYVLSRDERNLIDRTRMAARLKRRQARKLAQLEREKQGPQSSLRQEKTGSEIEKLKRDIELRDLEIQRQKGELIPLTEHHAELREFCGWFQEVHAQWLAEVRVLTGDAKLLGEAERLRDLACERMQAKCE